MLVAPLLRPLYGVAFGIASGQRTHMWRALKVLIFSMLIAIGVGYIAGLLAPVELQTSEMLSRTRPNFFDLIVAVASAIVAMLSLRYERLAESVAGVAIAAALLPPMVLVGIELAYGEWIYAQGSLILCLTNLLTIMFIGVSIMVMYGFSSQVERHWSTVRLFTAMGMMLIIISIPLFNSLVQITEQYFIENEIQTYINQTIEELQPEAKIQDIIVRFPIGGTISVESSLRLPEGNTIFSDTLTRLENGLTEKIGENITLDFDIIRSVSALSREESVVIQSPEEILEDTFEIYFSEIFQDTDARLISWKNIGDTIQLVVYTSDPDEATTYFSALEQSIQTNIKKKFLIDPIILQDQDISQIESSFSIEKDMYLLLERRVEDIEIVNVNVYIEEEGHSRANIVIKNSTE